MTRLTHTLDNRSFGKAPIGMIWPVLRLLGSPRLTLFILVALGSGVIATYQNVTGMTWAMVLPLILCALNLIAAIVTNGVFRWQLPLLIFHLCLLALILLVAAGRMTYLKGHLELTEGTWFEGELTASESGPWHNGRLDQVRFSNQGFRIDYDPGMRRGPTRNMVNFLDTSRRTGQMVIGDQTPLVLYGYRFYTSYNKGFAPTFAWTPNGSVEGLVGSVHLPAYPLHEYRQARSWRLPGSETEVWTMLQFDENLIDATRPDEFKLPKNHVLVLRVDGQRRELQPGQGVELAGGRLMYLGLRAWMGYTVFYDWTLPWLLAAALAAACALGWHFWQKFSRQPWNAKAGEEPVVETDDMEGFINGHA